MEQAEQFIKEMEAAYLPKGESITLGAGLLNNKCLQKARVNIPLKTLNRHGLISGATGTGKTKTLQLLAGALSSKGVPVLLMDIKGDLSGIAKPGESNPRIEERQKTLSMDFKPEKYPVEFLSLSEERCAYPY